jgi:SAM-dependent methyltransferase
MTTDDLSELKVLDFGCGTRKRKGAVGIDINPRTDADVIHDLGKFPYPFDDNRFEEVYVDNVIEHLDDVVGTMEEIYRILQNGGLVKIIVPYFRSRWAFIDPTHRHFFTSDSFAYFDPANPISQIYPYSTARFVVERVEFNEDIPSGPFKGLIKWIANRWPNRYERFLGHLIPMDSLSFFLRAQK